MHAERDYLIKNVFPELREQLERYHFHLIDIDLRWGITAEQAENGMVLDLCLDEIDRSRPFFVGILGQRYGWVPIEMPLLSTSNCRWSDEAKGKSITELEILHGVLRSPTMQQHAMFYLRQETFLKHVSPKIRDSIYIDGYKTKLKILTNEIEKYCSKNSVPLRRYPCSWNQSLPDRENNLTGRITGLEQFGEWVKNDLWNAIALEYPEIRETQSSPEQSGPNDWVEEEQDYHERFAELRTRAYVERTEALQALQDYLDDDSKKPLLLVGVSGAGKSALLAELCNRMQQEHPDCFLYPHFVGASSRSASYERMLRRCCLSIRKQFDIKETTAHGGFPDKLRPMAIPSEAWKIPEVLQRMLTAIPAERNVLIIIDAVDELDDVYGCHTMNWLPYNLPQNVKIIISATSDPRFGEMHPVVASLRRKKTPEVAVGLLTEAEQLAMLDAIPSISAKSLDNKQKALLIANQATRTPLFLIVALEELRGFGAFHRLENRIQQLPSLEGNNGLVALFKQVIVRLEQETDAELVGLLLSFMASSRSGLSEKELLALAQSRLQHEVSGATQLILRQLRAYLIHRGALLDFAHSSLRSAAEALYLETEAARNKCHEEMAVYFQSKCDSSGDRFDAATQHAYFELPFHIASIGEWEKLIGNQTSSGMLTHLDFIQAKCSAGLAHDLERDYEVIINATANFYEQARLQEFADFVRANIHHLEQNPADTHLMAYNWQQAYKYNRQMAYGYVHDAAKPRVKVLETPWLQRIYDRRYEAGHRYRKNSPVSAISIRADGKIAVSGREDGTLEVWDVEAPRRIRILTPATGQPVTKITFSRNGSFVLTYHFKPMVVKRWGLPSGEKDDVMTLGRTEYPSPAFFIDARYYVSAGSGQDDLGNIWVNDLVKENCTHHFWTHGSGIMNLTCTADGRKIVAVSVDGTLKMFDIFTGTCIATYHSHVVMNVVAASATGNSIVCGSEDGQIHFLQLRNAPLPPPAVVEIRVSEIRKPSGSISIGPFSRLPIRCPCCGSSLKLTHERRRLLAHYLDMAAKTYEKKKIRLADDSVLDMRKGGTWIKPPLAMYDDHRLLFPCKVCRNTLRASVNFSPELDDDDRVERYNTLRKTIAYAALLSIPLLIGLLGTILICWTRFRIAGLVLLIIAAPVFFTLSLPIPGKTGKWSTLIALLFSSYVGYFLTKTNTFGVIIGVVFILPLVTLGIPNLLLSLGLCSVAKCMNCGRQTLIFRWKPAFCLRCKPINE